MHLSGCNLKKEFKEKLGLTGQSMYGIQRNLVTKIKQSSKFSSFNKAIITLYFFLSTACLLSGCQQKTKVSGPRYGNSPISQKNIVYRFGIHPLHNPRKLMESYQPLMAYLNQHIEGVHFVLEASKDYASFEEKYKHRNAEFILPNPWQTLQAIKSGYTVIAMAGNPADFKGLFIVRKESNIKEPIDLKGKAISYPSPTALAACIIPQYFLHTHGVNVTKDITNLYVGSQESSIMNVFLKTTAAGATWPPPWRDFQKNHPKEAAELKPIWDIESLINNSVMVRNDVSAAIRNQVLKCLLELGNSHEGQIILRNIETDYFKPAQNEDYEIVQRYTERFEREVRVIDIKK